jgi:hypothetical protein
MLMPLERCHLRVLSFFRLARGSILASVIRIIPGGLLRVGALCVAGLFIVMYCAIVAQLIWVCETNMKLNDTGYVSFFGSDFRAVSVSRYHERSLSSVPRCLNKKQVAMMQITSDTL